MSRPRDLSLNYGIGDKNCEMDFFYNKDLFHTNTLNVQFRDYFLKENEVKTKKVEVKTLEYLLNLYFPQKKIDLLDIDAEGFDYEVLKGINFKKNIIELVMIEVHHFSKETINKVSYLLGTKTPNAKIQVKTYLLIFLTLSIISWHVNSSL